MSDSRIRPTKAKTSQSLFRRPSNILKPTREHHRHETLFRQSQPDRTALAARAADRCRAGVPAADAGRTACRRVLRSAERRLGSVPSIYYRPRSVGGDQAHPDYRRGGRSRQCRLGRGDGVAAYSFRLPRQAVADHPARFAVFRIARGGRFDVRLIVRRAHGIGRLARSARHTDYLRHTGHYFGDAVRYLPLCRTRNHSFNAGAGRQRRTGRANTRSKRLADVLARYPAQHQMGAALRHHSYQRPRDGRIRRGQRSIGTHTRRNQHHPAFGRNLLQRIQLHRRIRPLRRIGTFSLSHLAGAKYHHKITRQKLATAERNAA